MSLRNGLFRPDLLLNLFRPPGEADGSHRRGSGHRRFSHDYHKRKPFKLRNYRRRHGQHEFYNLFFCNKIRQFRPHWTPRDPSESVILTEFFVFFSTPAFLLRIIEKYEPSNGFDTRATPFRVTTFCQRVRQPTAFAIGCRNPGSQYRLPFRLSELSVRKCPSSYGLCARFLLSPGSDVS